MEMLWGVLYSIRMREYMAFNENLRSSENGKSGFRRPLRYPLLNAPQTRSSTQNKIHFFNMLFSFLTSFSSKKSALLLTILVIFT
ncbi:hypothetical protein [Neisseria sicca]|uniref:hypothetical protein n=1 Tax=Neisseria sicca TaxID=490 RepID=UPI0011BD0CB7|nr:hypothetical protein [Neisseria sicca]